MGLALRHQLYLARRLLLLLFHRALPLGGSARRAPPRGDMGGGGLAATIRPLARLHAPSAEAFASFRRDHPDSPVLVTGALEGWALRQWTPDRLRELALEVPLEMSLGGGDYRDAYDAEAHGTYAESETGANASRRAFVAGRPALLRDFVDSFILGARSSATSDDRSREISAFMAQHDVFAHSPELASACGPPPPLVGAGEPDPAASSARAMRRAWLGPAGTRTPLHRDPYHNLFCQAWGAKAVTMFPAAADDDAMCAYPRSHGFLRNTSRVDDAETPDPKRFPTFARHVARWDAELAGGDALFMPAGTWHQVRARDASLSVSYWWGRRRARE